MSRTPPVVPDLPELPAGASLDQVIAWAQNLRTAITTREPIATGDRLDKFVTRRELLGLNVLALSQGGTLGVGTLAGGGAGVVGGGSGPVDLSPPTAITGLTVSAALTDFFVEFDAPTYTQGHGNGYTSIYAANYAGSGPLPTFADAVEVYEVTGASTIAIIPARPGQATYFWVGAVTTDGVRQVDGAGPTGGTHGVGGTTGLIGNTDLGPLIVTADKLSQGAYPGLNIIPNGGSEDGTVCWRSVETSGAGGTLSIDTSTKTGGNSSFKLTKASTGDGCGMGSNAVPVIPGETYSVKLKAQGSSATGSGLYIICNESTTKPSVGYVTTAAATSRTTLLSNSPFTNTWSSYEYAYTVPAGVYWVTLEIVDWVGGPVGVWFDDAQMGRQITASSIAAGSIAVGTAAIQNGAIVNAMIGNLAVDNAKIASVSVGKLTAGSIAVGEYIQSTGFTAGSSGWRILGNGTAEFSFAMIRDTLVAAQIGAGQVTASKISVTSLDAITATIGTLRTASTGARMEIQDNKIRVYDSSNVCRIKFGDLS